MHILQEEIDYKDFLTNIGVAVIEQCTRDEVLARRQGITDRNVHSFINGKNFTHWLSISGIDISLVDKCRQSFWDNIDQICNK